MQLYPGLLINWDLATWNYFYKSGIKANKFIFNFFFTIIINTEYLWIKEKGIGLVQVSKNETSIYKF